MLDYVALLEESAPSRKGAASYAVVRHMARATEEDMVVDLAEVVEAGIVSAIDGRPNEYEFVDQAAQEIVMAEIGEARLPKLRAKADAARKRVGGSSQ